MQVEPISQQTAYFPFDDRQKEDNIQSSTYSGNASASKNELVLNKFILDASTTTLEYRGSIPSNTTFGQEVSPDIYTEFQTIIRSIKANIETDEQEKTDIPFNKMKSWLKRSGDSGINIFKTYISSEYNDDYIQAELLISLSEDPSISLYEVIIETLIENLNHFSPRVRYGAIMGISRTGNNHLLGELRKARQLEQNNILRNIIGKVIIQLELIT